MTLTVCIIAQDGIVLAADTRSTVGDPRTQTAINEPVKKIFPIGKHIGIGVAGDSGLALTIIDEFLREKLHSGEESIYEVTKRFRLKCVNSYNEWFPHLTPDNRPALEVVIAGYTHSERPEDQKPEIYTLSSSYNFAPLKNATGFDAIGLPRLAHYLLNTLYRPEIDVENAAQLAAFTIEETASQDAKVGSEVQLSTFSNTKDYLEFTKSELVTLKRQCNAFRESIKQHIYGKAIEEEARG
jgi:20S proteasome alpha/beta subunit